MIWHKDTENRIIRLNRAAANLMGLPVTAIEGKSVFDLDPEYADHYYEDDKEVIRTGEPKTGIIEPIITVTGDTRWLRTDKVPYRNRDGTIVGVIVFSVDITEFKRDEEPQSPDEGSRQANK
jgi:PAS domain S-box-containing protein